MMKTFSSLFMIFLLAPWFICCSNTLIRSASPSRGGSQSELSKPRFTSDQQKNRQISTPSPSFISHNKEGKMQAPLQAGVQTLELPQSIQIISPAGGEIFDWGETIPVGYSILPGIMESGDVTFKIGSPNGYELPTTMTHYYTAPELNGTLPTFDSIEDLWPGEAVSLEDLPAGDFDFEWTLPAFGGLEYGYGFTVRAHNGPHIGISEKFTMLYDCSLGTPIINIQPPQTVLRQGQWVTIVFAFCGWGGLWIEAPQIYLHDSSLLFDELGSFTVPLYEIIKLSEDRVRGALRVQIPPDYRSDTFNVFTLRYETGFMSSDPSFRVAPALEWEEFELTDLFRNTTDDIVAKVSVGGGMDGIALPMQVNDRILFPTVEAVENDIVIGSVPTSSEVPSNPENDCAEEWEVVLDPHHDFVADSTRNNTQTQAFSYYDNAGFVWLEDDLDGDSGHLRRVSVDCIHDHSYADCEVIVRIKNCSSHDINDIESLINVTQSGERPGEGLTPEPFTEPIAFRLFLDGPDFPPARDLPIGEEVLVRIDPSDLEARTSSTLTFDFESPITGWAGVENPFEVHLEFRD